ncbi:methyl-accepting chemotaxis protein [Kineothrix alysoides]|uniref:Methyl-accepting chemotaxis protein n=2 Tax=Kineothrix alysoides TaxID=1469948 RepID=A0A4R1QS19_9FIRM|nr:methyl-accepting chemotaxis protein [Kineothrix alysoides]TCL56618.1 methyl-accepting chemotaxis protein [Kineothrix alysoides]
MNGVQLDLTDERVAEQSRNYTAIVGVCIMNAILAAAYLIEVLKGARTIGSYAIVAACCILPSILAILAYFKKKETKAVRYITSVGFSLLYTYILFTSYTSLSFCYVIVIFVILAVYVDMKLSTILGIYALLANAVLTVDKVMTMEMSAKDITDTEIMFACLILTGVFTIMAHSKISKINNANIERVDKEKSNSEEVLQTVLQVADSMTADINKAAGETEQLEKSIEVTKGAMEELTGGANDAVAAILQQQKNTEEINKSIEEVEEVTDSIMNDVKNAEQNLTNGREAMEQLIHQMSISEEASRKVAQEMKELLAYADKMQGIMALISNVASQTGLLALNASIEAARAGEAGRGFAVVASEISSLAGQTSHATGDINDLIENITKSLSEVTESVGGLLDSNKVQGGYVNDTANNFKRIQTSTEDIFGQMGRLKSMVGTVSTSNRMIIESIGNVSAVTEEVTAGANETYEGSKWNLERVETLARVMEGLNENAEQLRMMERK